jgi:hypothetical protein
VEDASTGTTKDVPRMPPGAGLSTNAMDSSLKKDTCSDLDVALLVQPLADVPSGTSLSVGLGREMLGA